jgi:hypothetical protein
MRMLRPFEGGREWEREERGKKTRHAVECGRRERERERESGVTPPPAIYIPRTGNS